jgi:transposase-like protein
MSDDDNDGTPNTPPPLNPTLNRRRFTNQEKLGLVRSICRKIQVNNVSVRQACADVNIHHKQYLSWKREYSSIENDQNPMAKRNAMVSLIFEVFEFWGCFPNNFWVMRDDDQQVLGGRNSSKSYCWKNSRKRVLAAQTPEKI